MEKYTLKYWSNTDKNYQIRSVAKIQFIFKLNWNEAALIKLENICCFYCTPLKSTRSKKGSREKEWVFIILYVLFSSVVLSSIRLLVSFPFTTLIKWAFVVKKIVHVFRKLEDFLKRLSICEIKFWSYNIFVFLII